MTLVQQGKLNVDSSVSTYLPSLPKSWSDMRVMDLLSHQSGVADLLALQYHFTSLQQAMDTATARPLDFAPGTKTVYAGGDYAVVMQLVERISGRPFQQFLKENLLDKLGMQHTVYNNMEQDFIYRTYDAIPYAATVYKWVPERKQQRIFSMLFPSWSYPAGGLFSSIDDLTKWTVALDKGTLLSQPYLNQMWTASSLRNGTASPFGVGWIVDKRNGEKATGHSGGPALADINRLPGRKLTAIVLTNQLEQRPFLSGRLLDMYLADKK
jgi:CubicO group peptidase (beta-lactamase class C family)